MSKLSIDDQLYSASIGIYCTNSLFTRFASIADLSATEDDPYPCALPTHIHEYVHYLHNISTKAGVRLIYLTHCAIFLASHFLIKGENGIDVQSEDSGWSEDFRFFINNLNYIYGEFNEIEFDPSTKSSHWKFSNLSTYTPIIETPFFSYQVTVSENFSKKRTGVLRIGLTFITEGVAYEVEREVWKDNGCLSNDIDKATPTFPYLAYEHLVNYIVGRQTTAIERIKIGNAALMHESPSQGFVDACLALKKGVHILGEYHAKMIKELQDFSNAKINEMFDELEKFYSRTDKLLAPFQHYASIIKSTVKKRISHPDIESIFIHKNATEKNITPSCFLGLSSNVAEHCIIQEKSNSKATIDIIGDRTSLAASTIDPTWFYVLCSAIHFIQHHFKTDGTVEKTSNLREKKCPFSGACEAEASYNNPDVCKRFPWRFVPKDRHQSCWYSAGIKSITPEKI
ncbi:MAG: hypothetical protein Q8S32_06445 [Burkholderiaceae bacterium]|nr:hypothetical protein [Burkholderiaceae bacterium]